MKFRKAEKKDINAIAETKKYTYGYSDEYLNNYMNKLFFTDKCIVGEEDSEISAYIQRIDYGIINRFSSLTAGYISDVYTAPAKRRMGYMTECIKQLLESMHNEQMPFVFCVPFDYKIFDSIGFRLVSDIKEYHITADDIPSYKINGVMKNNIRFENPDESFINRISDIYDSYMKRNGARLYAMRSNIYWRNMLDDFINGYGGNFAVLYEDFQNISGYVLYTMEKDVLRVYEYAYKNLKAYKSILAFIKNYKYQTKKIIIKAAEDDMAYLDFAGNNNLIKIMPFAMARITNIHRVLTEMRTELSGINIRIFDPIISSNNGVWSIGADGVTPTSDSYDFETDIGTFTQLYLGYISAAEAFYMGYLKNVPGNSEKEQTVRNLFKKQNNYINMLL